MNCRYHNLCALKQLWPLETSQELSSVLILINIGEYKITIFSQDFENNTFEYL